MKASNNILHAFPTLSLSLLHIQPSFRRPVFPFTPAYLFKGRQVNELKEGVRSYPGSSGQKDETH